MKKSKKIVGIALALPFVIVFIVLLYLRILIGSSSEDDSSYLEKYSSKLITEQLDFNNFSELKFQGNWRGKIKAGDKYSVAVEGPESRVKSLRINQLNDKLTFAESIFRKSGSGRLEIMITMPEITEFRANGKSRFEINDFQADDLEIRVNGSSRLVGEGNTITDLELHGAGDIYVDFSNSKITNAEVRLVGSAEAELNMAGGNLTGSATGAASVIYSGMVNKQQIRTTGGSSVKKR